ncbi:hypothetical protein [Legionella oakridgensis]|uniref:Uncharacterized protein n=1 Tax=Legionella oakridgensis ATCC 33761 = DSM 21215 TaxID=1268635 RepID=W0B9K7_9GAMM|nr:hypothetical protein [Legionella oakridgensis]AHE67228.1 hypothetical protein Loa_01681 [Legionella oakridgensis ATCC 33761 = DSM 21215]STY20305.1 Uncharacterised protein [Legionella longbeachae]
MVHTWRLVAQHAQREQRMLRQPHHAVRPVIPAMGMDTVGTKQEFLFIVKNDTVRKVSFLYISVN